MKCLLVAINAKYIHSNLAVYNLKACADKAFAGESEPPVVELSEFTINHHAAELLDEIYLKKADILCFSCYIWNIDAVRLLVRNLKKLSPQVPIWLGGPEVSFQPEETMAEFPEIEGILLGEGERTFPKFLAWKMGRGELPEGICLRRGEELFMTPPAPCADMDRIPFVYEDMREFENRILYYETSRGCPFRCSYCLSSIDKKLRFRSWELVERELRFFLEHKVPQVKFVDRTFNCREEHCLRIWRYLRDNDNGITNFHFEIAADLLTEEEIALIGTMRPGLIQLEIGVQSTNPDTINAIRRKMDLSEVARIVAAVNEKHNVHQHLDLIAGLPFEDYESFGRSFDEVYAMRPSQLQLGFLKVLKGSPMYEDAKQYEILYQSEAPFEVLKTPWLPREDVIKLKHIEEMVESCYNSCQFTETLPVLVEEAGSPFRLFEELSEYYRRRDMHKKKHVRSALYELLLEYAADKLPERSEEVRLLLTKDYYLRENAKKRPDFALPQEEYKDRIRNAIRKHFPEEPLKQVLNRYHPELFSWPFGREEILLFDYEHRDALTENASIIKLEE